MIIRKICSLICLMCCLSMWGQSIKHEMRGNWLATVYRLNWPPAYAVITSPNDETNIKKQQAAMIKMLDGFANANQNVVFFQVRSRCDAMYKSSFEPWSSDLVATRGMDPGYDPLQFVIEEGHKRGLEIHAWVNPYRFESTAGQWSGMAGDYATTNPDWVIQVNNSTILNPGKPEVRDRITNVIEEIVRNYDVDGIIFDDYFYLQGITTQDAAEQKLYNTEGLSVGDWRRSNVNKMIAQVNDMIQKTKPYVRFGVSPAGIWGGSSEAAYKYGVIQPEGISSGYAYNGIYCDPLAWLYESTIDYISPQVYWTIGSNKTDYAVLSEWWSNIGQQFSRHFYSSQSISDLDPWKSGAQRTIQIREDAVPAEGISGLEYGISVQDKSVQARFGYAEIGNQIDCNRLYDQNNAPGSIFYSAKKFLETSGFIPYLLENQFKAKSLPPSIFWKGKRPMQMVTNLNLNSANLSWDNSGQNMRYAIYAMPVSEPLKNLDQADYLCGISYSNEFELPADISAASHYIGVSILDRFANESPIAVLNKVASQLDNVTLLTPNNNETVIIPTTFNWSSLSDASSYRIEISETSDFSTLKGMRETKENTVSSEYLFPLENGKEYYWRVLTSAPGSLSGVSEVRKFNVFSFEILSPTTNEVINGLTPTISWTPWKEANNYLLEVSTSTSFDNNVIFSKNFTNSSIEMPEEVLKSNTSYYIRVTASGLNATIQTPIVSFKTEELIPTTPIIIAPIHESSVIPGTVSVMIDKNPNASGFRYELSQSESFPPRSTNIKTVDAFNYKLDYDLVEGVYYARVRANYGSNTTPWSNVVKFNVSIVDGITAVNSHDELRISTDEKTHYLHLPVSLAGSIIRVYDDYGKLIMTEICHPAIYSDVQQIINLNTNEWAKGVYVVSVCQGNDCKIQKIIK